MHPRTKRHLLQITKPLARLVLGALGAVLVLALYIALCWLAYAASYNPQTLTP